MSQETPFLFKSNGISISTSYNSTEFPNDNLLNPSRSVNKNLIYIT